MASVGSVMAGCAFIKLTMDDAQLKRGLDNAQNKFKAFAAGVNAWSSQMALVAPLISAPLLVATRTFARFDDQMRQVQAVTGATGDAFQSLTELAKKLGRETSFTASQVAEGMLSLGRMGLNPQEIENSVKAMMALSRVTGTELGVASEIAANNLRVFGLEASQMSHVADILSVTANSSAQNLVDLGESLKMAGPHAKRAGADLTDTAAALGILANMGIRGSLAGTALGKSYKRLADPKIISYLKSYGVETLNADGSMRKMRDTLVDIAKVMKNMTNAQQITFAEEVFDARGSLGGGTLTVNTDAIDQLVQKLKESEGAAEAAMQKMEAGLGGALREMESAAEGVSIALGEVIAVSFTPLIRSASSFLLALRELVGENGKMVGGLLQVTTAVVAFGAGLKALTFAGGLLKGMLSPLLALDAVFSCSARAAKAEAAAASEAAKATANAEKLKELAKTRSDAVRVASENRRHYMELKNAAASAQAVVSAEAKKLAAAKARLAAEAALNEKVKYQYTLATGSSAGFVPLPDYTAAQAGLKAQEQAMQKSIAASQVATRAAEQAKNVTLQSAAVAKTAAAAYTQEAAAQAFVSKKSTVYGAALGKLNTVKLFSAALSQKHAKTVMVASVAEIAASKRVAGASAIRRTMYYAEAAGAKVAAAATLGLSKILAVISAHPVIVALIALVAAYKGLMWATERAAEAQEREIRMNQRLSQEATGRRKALEEIIKTEDGQMRSLMDMEKQGKLSAKQMFDAQTIVANLTEKYGDLGIQFDTLTGQILGTVEAYKKLNGQQREALIAELEQEAQTAKSSADSTRRGFSANYNWNDKLWTGLTFGSDDDFNLMMQLGYSKERGKWNLTDYDGEAVMERMVAARNWANDKGMDEEAQKIQRIIDELKKYEELQKRIKSLRDGGQVVPDENGTGSGMTPDGKRLATTDELEKAQQELARMDEDRARKSRTNLENEIVEIEKLKEKYRELIQMKLEALKADQERYRRTMEENKAQSTPQQRDAYDAAYRASVEGRAEMERLQGQLASADAGYDQQIADARQREEKRRAERQKPYDNFLGDLDSRQSQDRQRQTEERTFNNAMNEKNFDAAYQYVEGLFNAQAEALRIAREKYTQMLEQSKSADSEGGADISDAEAKALGTMQREIEEAVARSAALQDKMTRAREAADDAGDTAKEPAAKATGAWSLEELNAALGGGSAADRTASATEKTAQLAEQTLEQQKKQNQKLDDIKKKTGKSGTLTYS